MSSAALRESSNPIPVNSLMLSSHLFCLPLLLAPFTVPCRIVFAMQEDLEMWPYHLSFRFFFMVRRSSCTPIAFWILLQTPSFVTWFVGNVQKSPIESHLKGLDPSLDFCYQILALTGIKDGGYDERPHQLNLKSKRDVLVPPYDLQWFESYLVANSRRQVFSRRGSYVLLYWWCLWRSVFYRSCAFVHGFAWMWVGRSYPFAAP